jgi:DnaK suppressor protein
LRSPRERCILVEKERAPQVVSIILSKGPAMAVLTRKEQEAFARRLSERRRALISEIIANGEPDNAESLRNQYEDLDPHDDRAVGDWVRDIGLAQFERETAELRAVESALKRVADGSFGECVDCGEAIARARLEANPSAERCIACQEQAETRAGGVRTAR